VLSPFGHFVSQADQLVVQCRMGFSNSRTMRAGLGAVKAASATTVGTITLDSYTRVGDHAAARAALSSGRDLNGYPLVVHGAASTRAVLAGLDFPVQVRHGSAVPQEIMRVLIRSGLDATEGGPVSYCLPYGRTPLRDSVRNWAECCELLLVVRERGVEPHLETFGGCIMGQMCPPSLLVAVSLLEGMFFRQHGLRSISLSYAQQTNLDQDAEAIWALRRLAERFLSDVDWHVVLYAYMGMYPRSSAGAVLLLERCASLAVRTGVGRMIVKTTAEAYRIPTVAENVAALETAGLAAAMTEPAPGERDHAGTDTFAEAEAIVHAVLNLADDVGTALLNAFARGLLDVPYCLHPDNAGRTRSRIDWHGRLRWADVGGLPIPRVHRTGHGTSSADLLAALSYVQRTVDNEAEKQ
jgi:methylaspartate mutase epsilon subunit